MKISQRERHVVKLSKFVKIISERGKTFKSWPKEVIPFCSCGSTLHNSATCPLRRTRLEKLRLLEKFDKNMYEFLSTILQHKNFLKIDNFHTLETSVKGLQQREEKFWSPFFQKFWPQKRKSLFSV